MQVVFDRLVAKYKTIIFLAEWKGKERRWQHEEQGATEAAIDGVEFTTAFLLHYYIIGFSLLHRRSHTGLVLLLFVFLLFLALPARAHIRAAFS